jgi:hypothetical protein
MALPLPVSSLLSGAPAVGFSGSRAPAPASVQAARAAVAVAARPILVGDQRGIDMIVRSASAGARVFRVADYGTGRGAFAARSIAVAHAVTALGGRWAAFPAAACPAGLRPSSSAAACFSGSGSGTWASLALALGLGLPAVVFLPEGIQPPATFGLVAAGAGWWVAIAPAHQLALF